MKKYLIVMIISVFALFFVNKVHAVSNCFIDFSVGCNKSEDSGEELCISEGSNLEYAFGSKVSLKSLIKNSSATGNCGEEMGLDGAGWVEEAEVDESFCNDQNRTVYDAGCKISITPKKSKSVVQTGSGAVSQNNSSVPTSNIGSIGNTVELENPLGTTKIPEILGGIVKKLLTILGSISLLVLVAGGFLWLTSAGNAEKVKLGTNTMLYAIIGLFIIFSSYAILNTVIGGLTGGKIASQSSGATESSETTGGDGAKTKLELANEVCKGKNKEFSCVNIVNCEGVTGVTSPDKKIAEIACTKAGDGKCINGACPGVDDVIKCCKPIAPATQTTSGSSTGDSCGGAEHPTWSCMDINHCDIPLGKENNLTKQRSICKKSTGSCILGKCKGGDEIVCCEKAPEGTCVFGVGEYLKTCAESKNNLIMNKHNCDALGGVFSTNNCEQRKNEIEPTDLEKNAIPEV